MEPTEELVNINIEEIYAVVNQMKENGKASELIKGSVEEMLHRKALQIAQLNNIESIDKNMRNLLNIVFQIAKEDVCTKSLTVTIIQDIFDVLSIDDCEYLFSIVEDNLSLWKNKVYYEWCKNTMLRMCNDLLKRLSQSINTSFCGRVLVLLSNALPLCEKSGLNLLSHFNSSNATLYDLLCESAAKIEPKESLSEENIEEDIETGEIKENCDIPIDFALYAKFWQLQTFFTAPNSCYDKSKWKIFHQNTNDVLNILLTHKLGGNIVDSNRNQKKKRRINEEVKNVNTSAKPALTNDVISPKGDNFFAKYVTSQKLLQLQLNDSQFRRYFLVQCLVLYQYLVSDIKFKDKSFVLNEDQLRFLIESTDKCYKLLRDTYPEGNHFADSIKKILQREKEWSEWKNKGCNDYTLLARKERMGVITRRARKGYNPNELDLGSNILTSLWKGNADILDACQDRKRKYTPSLVNFLRDPLVELDPEQMVEEQYKSVNNETFQWRASRMLMNECPSYFQIQYKRNEVTTSIGSFLEQTIKQTASTIGELRKEAPGIFKDDNKEEVKQNGDNDNKQHSPIITNDQIKQLSNILSTNLNKIENLLSENYNIQLKSSSTNEPSKCIIALLNEWKKQEGGGATVKRLGNLLLEGDLYSEQVAVIFRTASTTKNN